MNYKLYGFEQYTVISSLVMISSIIVNILSYIIVLKSIYIQQQNSFVFLLPNVIIKDEPYFRLFYLVILFNIVIILFNILAEYKIKI